MRQNYRIEITTEEMSQSKKHFKSHFNPYHTKIKISAEIEHMPIYIQSLQNPSANINHNEPILEKIKKAIKKTGNNKVSLDIEAELLKIIYFLFKIKIFLSHGIRNASIKSEFYHTLMDYTNKKLLTHRDI